MGRDLGSSQKFFLIKQGWISKLCLYFLTIIVLTLEYYSLTHATGDWLPPAIQNHIWPWFPLSLPLHLFYLCFFQNPIPINSCLINTCNNYTSCRRPCMTRKGVFILQTRHRSGVIRAVIWIPTQPSRVDRVKRGRLRQKKWQRTSNLGLYLWEYRGGSSLKKYT